MQNYAYTAFCQSVGFPRPLCLISLIHLSENHSTNLQTWQIRNGKEKQILNKNYRTWSFEAGFLVNRLFGDLM